MVEHTQSKPQQSADANPVARQIRPNHGPLAGSVQDHVAGLGLGVVGLLIGAIVASPVLAAVGLIGGAAAGTVFLDRRKDRGNSNACHADSTPSAGRQPSDSPTTAANLSTGTGCGPNFSQIEMPVGPGPTAGHQKPNRIIR